MRYRLEVMLLFVREFEKWYSFVPNCRGAKLQILRKKTQVHFIIIREWPKTAPYFNSPPTIKHERVIKKAMREKNITLRERIKIYFLRRYCVFQVIIFEN